MSDEVNNGYSSEQEEEVRRFLREKKVRKLLKEINLNDSNINNYERNKIFDQKIAILSYLRVSLEKFCRYI